MTPREIQALEHPCPRCRAPAGSGCVNLVNIRRPMRSVHRERLVHQGWREDPGIPRFGADETE